MYSKALAFAVFPPEQTSSRTSIALDYVIATPAHRFVVVHYHILKNAGTTIEFVLNREFGEDFARLHGSDAGSILGPAHAEAFLAEHPPVRALSSHHLTYPKPQVSQLVVFDICFLRDPIDRLASFYQHLQRSDMDEELSPLAARSDLRSFVKVLVRNHPHLANDAQVNRLAKAGAYTRPPNESDLEKASAIVREASVPGVVDLFDESCVAAEYALAPAFPGIQLHYVKRNVSPESEPKTADLRTALGKHLFSQLQEMNRLDRELVDRARAEVRHRYHLVPDHEERLRDFRDRCALTQLAEGADWTAGA